MGKPQSDQITLTVRVRVEGTDFEEMIRQGKLEGAARLKRFEDEVYVMGHTQPTVAKTTRFRAHLGVPVEIEAWAIEVAVGIKEKDDDGESPSAD